MNYSGAGSDACHFTLWDPVYIPVVLLNLNCSKRIFPIDYKDQTETTLFAENGYRGNFYNPTS